ncbi:hypothetical protein K5I29_04485 [Flavobacterium agricola]|uniref:Uncharacterized protein n=1 Tax=Flavobacterium agricola TaxID=2870839 RepID=A0ABY6M0T6_9FLAO|nr:hypothetical protein [Flavobacterium agricola]UYW02165.1 hypothetical protein K5I29_04485 [Flavobacterium agricola]
MLKEDNKELITKKKVYNIVGIVFIYLFIYFQFIDFIFVLNFEYKPLYLVASVILLLMSILTTVSFILKRTMKKTLLLIAIFMMICSSFIYVCQIYYVEIESLYFWSLITQSIFYFFLINYYLINNKKEEAV